MVDFSNVEIIQHSKWWVDNVVVGLNFCPFAKPVIAAGGLSYTVVNEQGFEQCLTALMTQVSCLDENTSIETALLIYPLGFEAFNDYLDFVAVAEELLSVEGFDGVYQLASFHPDYCFDGSQYDDAANYTNRSPYPMLHLLREDSIEEVLSGVTDPEKIPSRNIEFARKKGAGEMQELLNKCKS